MQNDSNPRKSFVLAYLPWLVAAGAFAVYFITLNRWVSLSNIQLTSQVTGWDWRPPFLAPLLFAVTYPLRWLPAAWQPAGLNLLTVACAAGTLALLARSVSILPHDRTREQRVRERSEFSCLTQGTAWLPPVLAVLVCGLQLTFWENAVNATGEALDLLLFAYVIRCLLEFRLKREESWLKRMALVYGLAATNNFAMIGFFPAFLVAVVWIKGLEFFNIRFMVRMVLCGLAGLSLYFLLPLLIGLSSQFDTSFWEILRLNLGTQKARLTSVPRFLLMLVSATSVVPVLIMGIRWPSSFGDTSAAGFKLTNAMFYVLHAIFLLACIYVAFDLVFSPRSLAANHGVGTSFLTLYYLGALSVGYFSGYFLLVFGQESGRPWDRPSLLRRTAGWLITVALWALLVAVPAGLAYQNLPLIRANSTPALANYGRHLAESLPAQGGMVLSDDPNRLYALAAALDQSGTRKNYVLLDTLSLQFTSYHKFLRNQYGDRWPKSRLEESRNPTVDSFGLSQWIYELTRTNFVCYLHPSYGYYFEVVYPKPHGLVYRLFPNDAKVIETPPLSAGEIEQTEAAWRMLDEELKALARSVNEAALARAVKETRKKKTVYANEVWAGIWYSRALNHWGVELQKRNELEKAAHRFAQAIAVNPENPVAVINQDFNAHLRSGLPAATNRTESLQKQLDQYRGNWQTLLTYNGPLDEPAFCFELGQVLHKGNLFRQAAYQFLRVQQLTPDAFTPAFWLANVYVQGKAPGLALELIQRLRSQKNPNLLNPTNAMLLASVEGAAYLAENKIETAVKIFEEAEQTNPQNSELLTLISRVYASNRMFSNALAATERQLKLDPDSPEALLNKGAYSIELRAFDQAIPPLNRLLELQPDFPSALFNRAIAYLRTDKLDAAQLDFERLEHLVPPNHTIYYGLGEIAFRKNQKRTAMKNYTSYLKYAPLGTAESRFVTDRLKELKDAH